MGKEILFPENVSCYIAGKEELLEVCSQNFKKEFKILLYVDSAGCSECRLKLFEWKQLMEETDSLFQGKVGFLFFFQPKNVHEVVYLSAHASFDHPVFVDINGTINGLNRFPQIMEYQCFLLDKNNNVLSIGNPVLNFKIWELYKMQIADKNGTKPEVLTTVVVDKTIYDYGIILKGSSNPAVFTITNTGNHSLAISHISASCGCTNVDWNKRPIEPKETVSIYVEMIPDETGYFNKTLDVYCNISESPVRLMVNGIVTK